MAKVLPIDIEKEKVNCDVKASGPGVLMSSPQPATILQLFESPNF